MSTNRQDLSPANQLAAISAYAQARGFELVRTYVDGAKSGLSIAGRPQLQQLIADVESGEADFVAVLVYDVSRWGRFQHVDESAYYEFRCLRFGVQTHYCAETFENDGTPLSAVLKNLKRAMAAEFSRELSEKVIRGQTRLATLGYHMGGLASYGLRRLLLDEHGNPRMLLEDHQRKALSTDRVVLVEGPEFERETLRTIFRQYADEGWTMRAIAARLNKLGVPSPARSKWDTPTLGRLLRNRRFVGQLTFNKTSRRLMRPRTSNPPDQWASAQARYAPIIAADLFARAQERLAKNPLKHSVDEIVHGLHELLAREGTLNKSIIDRHSDLPSTTVLRRRFGSLEALYRLAGFEPTDRRLAATPQRRLTLKLKQKITRDLVGVAAWYGEGVVICDKTGMALLKDQSRLQIRLLPCTRGRHNLMKWRLLRAGNKKAEFLLIILLDAGNAAPFAYFLFPRAEIPSLQLSFHEGDPYRFDRFACADMDAVYAAIVDYRKL